MKKTIITALALSSLVSSANASLAPWLSIDGQVNVDATAKDSEEYERKMRTEDAEIRFQALLASGVKAVVKFELQEAGFTDDEAEKAIEEAYIQWDAQKATVIFGKHQMAFGSKLSQDPMFKDNQLYKLMTQDEVMGVTVALPKGAFGIVDTVAMSVFETTAGDLNMGDDYAASIKVTKALSKQIEAQVSAMIKQNSTDTEEKRASLGIVYQSNDGKLMMWAEGVVTDMSEDYGDYSSENSRLAGRAGASYKMGPGAIIVEASALEDETSEYNTELLAAYRMDVSKNLELSAGIRHQMKESDDSSDTMAFLRARLKFQAEKATRPLIGG